MIRRDNALSVTDADIANEVLRDNQYRLSREIGLNNAVFVDVGGHIGTFSAAVLALFDGASVLVYEPDSENFSFLIKNLAFEVERNRAHCFNVAVDAREGELSLYVNTSNRGGSITRALEGDACAIPVKAHSIRDILESIAEGSDVVLKLDCEGAEYAILDSLFPMQIRSVCLVIMELHLTPALSRERRDPAAVLHRLTEAGFRVYVLEEIVYAGEGVFWIVAAVNQRFSHLGALGEHYAACVPRIGGDRWYRRITNGRQPALRGGVGWWRGKLWLAMGAGVLGWGEP
ncbi:FkbM family methyltransferase [Roseomonas sp. CECT 9278]|uniref:FkbM family methyltransferase n=1 Tax=Roseomonas sp. CECT 9278 TaxID=2845823 RepID=UPI001E2C5D1D|nr:FkbM family methyltransferase [Roseomonas sp. CECT 9278]